MTIGELSTASGVPASTIRYWERVGVLPKPPRSGGQRRYGPGAADRIALVRLAQSCGFHLEETRRLLHGFAEGVTPSQRWQELARRKQAEIEEGIARLNAMRTILHRVRECQCRNLGECARIASASVNPAA